MLLERRAARLRGRRSVVVEHGREMVVFERSGARYAVPLVDLASISRSLRITGILGASPSVCGVINVRSRIVPVHDLSARAGGARLPDEPWFLVAEVGTVVFALLADVVEGVERFSPEAIRDLPLTLAARADCLSGIGEDGTVFLKLDALIQDTEFFHA